MGVCRMHCSRTVSRPQEPLCSGKLEGCTLQWGSSGHRDLFTSYGSDTGEDTAEGLMSVKGAGHHSLPWKGLYIHPQSKMTFDTWPQRYLGSVQKYEVVISSTPGVPLPHTSCCSTRFHHKVRVPVSRSNFPGECGTVRL